MAALFYNYLNGAKSLLYQVISKHNALTDSPRRDDKVAIVTGGSTGIGYETVRGLCQAGMSVIIATRSEEAAQDAIKRLKEQQPHAKVRYQHLDLSSLSSVREFASKFQETESHLHVLVNNAGVMLTPYGTTRDGFELQIGINHLGHFALTLLLLDTMKKSGTKECCARIVTVSSSAHSVGSINFDDLQSKNYYDPYAAYSQSKLACVLFTYALQKLLSDDGCHVTANSLHPGVVNTDLFRHVPWVIRVPQRIIAKLLFFTPEQGASTSLYCCLAPELEAVGGKYFSNCQEMESNAESYKQDVQRKLWDISCQLTEINNGGTN